MKNTKIRLATLLISSSLVCAALASCSSAEGNNQLTSAPNTTNQENTVATDASVYLMQIEYYESLIKDLEAQLLKEKEENYINASAHKQSIAELEEKIASLNQKIDALTQNSQSTSKYPEFQEQSSTKPNTENKTETQTESKTENKVEPQTGYFTCSGNTITGYVGNESILSLPRSQNGTIITEIGESAFENGKFQKIILPDGIKNIGWFAFSGCKNLYEIYIPSSVTHIGYGAFENCSSFLVIKCPKDSYAEAFAKSWGIVVITEE